MSQLLIEHLCVEMGIPFLRETGDFPAPLNAPEDSHIAGGGQLTVDWLLYAYRRGIFPWYSYPEIIFWSCPGHRMILQPAEIHIPRRLRRQMRQQRYAIYINRDFHQTISSCADPTFRTEPTDEPFSTWVFPEIVAAYNALHEAGYAHSIEVYSETDNLIGGIYGVCLGKVFFGESMFSAQPGGSKIALVSLSHFLAKNGFHFLDCQLENPHLRQFGAITIPRLDFLLKLAEALSFETDPTLWQGNIPTPIR